MTNSFRVFPKWGARLLDVAARGADFFLCLGWRKRQIRRDIETIVEVARERLGDAKGFEITLTNPPSGRPIVVPFHWHDRTGQIEPDWAYLFAQAPELCAAYADAHRRLFRGAEATLAAEVSKISVAARAKEYAADPPRPRPAAKMPIDQAFEGLEDFELRQ